VPSPAIVRIVAAVQAKQSWNFEPQRWQPSKGQIVLDEAESRLGLEWSTWACLRTHRKGRASPYISVDIQWGDSTRSPERVRSQEFYQWLIPRQRDLELAIKSKTKQPGSFYLESETDKANWMMQGGFAWKGDDLDLDDPAMFTAYVDWLIRVVPVARNHLIMELNKFADSYSGEPK
jgi:hypothetical protein